MQNDCCGHIVWDERLCSLEHVGHNLRRVFRYLLKFGDHDTRLDRSNPNSVWRNLLAEHISDGGGGELGAAVRRSAKRGHAPRHGQVTTDVPLWRSMSGWPPYFRVSSRPYTLVSIMAFQRCGSPSTSGLR